MSFSGTTWLNYERFGGYYELLGRYYEVFGEELTPPAPLWVIANYEVFGELPCPCY